MRLTDVLPGSGDEDAVYEAIGTWVESQQISLYPAQDEAILELVSGSNVVLATPTGSGKSLVATAAMAAALDRNQCAVYTAPIKALVSEKFFDLCEVFGADDVGMLTGDAAVNADAPIVCATAEVLANLALREGAGADVGLVVMDEFHYYADPDRGWAWQVPLLELPRAQFLLMSATLGDTTVLRDDLTRRTGRPSVEVASAERPVPLVTEYVTTPTQETIEQLVSTDQAPVYVVHFTQAAALERAQALTSVKVASREERDAIVDALGDFRFRAGFGRTLSRLVRMGIGVHHAGMLPRYRRLVETLAQRGLLKVICGTDTLGVGINVPIRTVLFAQLSKFDGVRQRLLQVREFQQIAGRAGRAGFDTVGYVVAQAPEHEVENAKALAKAGDDPKRRRKVVRKKPPEGFVSWSESTFERLVDGTPEPLSSRMRITHSMVLDLLARSGDTEQAIEHLIESCDESEDGKRKLRAEAAGIIEALIAGGVVERTDAGLALRVELPDNFALNQPLSPFAIACFELLDPQSPSYALDVVSVIEATLEDPRPVISAQRFRARGEAVAELKAEGVDYDERMELLEEIEHPQPLRDLLEDAYETYRGGHPWVGEHELRPKSVVREMVERAMTFAELIADYQLSRSEGVVLRYLSDAYRALVRTVPPAVVDEELADLVAWLGELVRQTDSSLLDEWEQLVAGGQDPQDVRPRAEGAEMPRPVTKNERAFRVLVRNAAFRRVELAAFGRWEALAELDPEIDWRSAMDGYFAEYDDLGTGPGARGPSFFQIEVEPGRWLVRQTFDDPEGHHDWGFSATVDLAASDEAGEAVLAVTSVGPFGS